MDFDRLLEQLHTHGLALARSADYAPFDTAVPSCPGWNVGRLLGHLAKVQRWSTYIVRSGSPEGFSYERPPDDQLISYFLAGLDELLVALRETPADRPIWTMWPVRSPRLYWARRQAHEAAIHRVDMELAVGYGVSDFEPDFAADGIDELIMGLLPLGTKAEHGPGTIVIEPLDMNVSWTVRVNEDGLIGHREATAAADLSIFGLSSDLYRWVWNRADDSEVSARGDLTRTDWWRATANIGTN